mmetsp:Transcript_7711/g.10644  ORF Transcript_7711/g.10644 Transcript_7711/m.10644 type:complete len:103 (-) Transcript_7711:85-393(-)
MASSGTNNTPFADIYSSAVPNDYEEFLLVLDDYGWRKLGSELGFTARELDRFERGTSPTKDMIKAWMNKEQATLQKMLQALTTIDHYTARRQLDKIVAGAKK